MSIEMDSSNEKFNEPTRFAPRAQIININKTLQKWKIKKKNTIT